MEDILAILLIFGGGTAVALSMSPIGRAIASRISGRVPAANAEELREIRDSYDAMQQELETVRQEVGELQERLDFTERMLARKREDAVLPPGSGASP